MKGIAALQQSHAPCRSTAISRVNSASIACVCACVRESIRFRHCSQEHPPAHVAAQCVRTQPTQQFPKRRRPRSQTTSRAQFNRQLIGRRISISRITRVPPAFTTSDDMPRPIPSPSPVNTTSRRAGSKAVSLLSVHSHTQELAHAGSGRRRQNPCRSIVSCRLSRQLRDSGCELRRHCVFVSRNPAIPRHPPTWRLRMSRASVHLHLAGTRPDFVMRQVQWLWCCVMSVPVGSRFGLAVPDVSARRTDLGLRLTIVDQDLASAPVFQPGNSTRIKDSPQCLGGMFHKIAVEIERDTRKEPVLLSQPFRTGQDFAVKPRHATGHGRRGSRSKR